MKEPVVVDWLFSKIKQGPGKTTGLQAPMINSTWP
jgi:hypothetical protein